MLHADCLATGHVGSEGSEEEKVEEQSPDSSAEERFEPQRHLEHLKHEHPQVRNRVL